MNFVSRIRKLRQSLTRAKFGHVFNNLKVPYIADKHTIETNFELRIVMCTQRSMKVRHQSKFT